MTMPSRFITDAAEYAGTMRGVEGHFHPARRLPEQVFRAPAREYRFLEFGETMREPFWSLLRALAAASGDPEVVVAVLEPDAEHYFHHHFGFFAAARLPATAAAGEYLDLFRAEPPGSPADALMHHGDVIAFASPSGAWLAWAEREMEVAVVALRDAAAVEAADRHAAGIGWLSVDEALHEVVALAFDAQTVPAELADALRANYPSRSGDARPGTTTPT